jgi:hypothetical protein
MNGLLAELAAARGARSGYDTSTPASRVEAGRAKRPKLGADGKQPIDLCA